MDTVIFFFFAPELAFLLQPAKVTCYFYKFVHTKAEKEVRKTEHEKKSCFPCWTYFFWDVIGATSDCP
jgi:hypothetical protein